MRRAIAAMHDRLAPGERDTVIGHLVGLALFFPQQALSPTQASAKFRVFAEDIREMPSGVVERACAAYRRDPKSEFYPTPGKIIAAAADEMRRVAVLRRGLTTIEAALDGRDSDARPSHEDCVGPERMVDLRQRIEERRRFKDGSAHV